MKIMDVSGSDGECQVESVSSKTKKSKQGRLPFQTLSRDSPVANKKRKSVASPDVRNAKQAKVNTKENSFKGSKKTDDEDIVLIDKEMEGKEENKINEANDVKDCSKQSVSAVTPESISKKTPGKGSTKSKKLESKIQTNSLTKFFKKIDNKETKNENSTSTSEPKEKSEKTNNVNNKSKEQKKSQDETKSKENSDTESTKARTKKQDKESDKEKSKEVIVDVDSDKDSKINSEESDDSSSSEDSKDKSELNVTSNVELDSDINLLSDEDEDDDDDDEKSDTDSKKTEHEETDERKSEATLATPTRSKLLNSYGKGKKLTPKQFERKMEIQKKKESRAKQRLEREKKLQEERENRKKEKEEKRKEREEKRREREEKEKMLKEQKKKEKEQKELKKQAEIEQKQKEKEAKEEERRKREEAKEEEKRRKEEERLEAERKKQKAASNFASFFVAKKPAETKPVEEDKKVERKNFMPFEIKADMRIAPTTRRNLSENEKTALDKIVKNSSVKKSELYINNIKHKTYHIRKSERTWPYEANDDVVILEEEEEDSNVVQAPNAPGEKPRAKLLLFHENRRPPYWGTWRKKSKAINPRKPFEKDTQWFDYEVDSDDEWEEEEPGESLRGSDDEKDEENADDNEYDVDNDFMVPHGYLSEEEIGADEEDEDDELNPEKQEKKLKILGEQFEAERNTKTTKLKPKVIGCVWLDKENTYPESTPSHSVKFLTTRHAWVREIPVTLTAPADADGANDPDCGTSANRQSVASSARKAQALVEAMPDLVRLLHGNTHRRGFLVKEFLEYWSKKKEAGKSLPKARLHQKITEVATWTTCTDAGPMQDKQCWIVSEEVQNKYLPEEKLAFPNQWTYCLAPKKKIAETTEKTEEKEKEKEKEKKLVPLITQYTKPLTAEEKQKQLAEKPTPSSVKAVEKTAVSSTSKATPPTSRPPKRVALVSVPRGQPLPKSPRVSLMDKFVTKDESSGKIGTQPKKTQDDDDDDIMIIDDDDEEGKDKVIPQSVSLKRKIKDETKPEKKPPAKKEVDVELKDEEENDPKNVSASSDVDIIEI